MQTHRIGALTSHGKSSTWTKKPAKLFEFLILFALPVVVQAQFNYTTNNGTITIEAYTGPGGAVIIPGSINGLPVTTIGDWAFNLCTNLTRITIPDSVVSLGVAAFQGCVRLADVTIPDSVTHIGNFPFNACTGLKNLTIGNGVTSIEYLDYEGCNNLTRVSIGSHVSAISFHAFNDCDGLAFVVDGNNPVYSSLDGVLFNKSQTTLIESRKRGARSYVIPNSVRSIGANAFQNCTGLTKITIPNSVTSIGSIAFYNCTGLTSVTIPNSVTSIGDGAFGYCNLTGIVIPDRVTRIEHSTFINCASLTSVTIPAGVSYIGDYAFEGCTSLTGVYFMGDAPSSVGIYVLLDDNNATIYYLPGTLGWTATFGGRPTALWSLPNPLVLNNSRFGLQRNGFGFVISWATNVPVVVEASTNLADTAWVPLSTNTLTGGSSYFSDPQWTTCPNRFYRLRWPN